MMRSAGRRHRISSAFLCAQVAMLGDRNVPREPKQEPGDGPGQPPGPSALPQPTEGLLSCILGGVLGAGEASEEERERSPMTREKCVQRGGIVRGQAREQDRIGRLIIRHSVQPRALSTGTLTIPRFARNDKGLSSE